MVQGSKPRWPKEGDDHTRYFHTCVKSLRVGKSWVEDVETIRSQVVRWLISNLVFRVRILVIIHIHLKLCIWTN